MRKEAGLPGRRGFLIGAAAAALYTTAAFGFPGSPPGLALADTLTPPVVPVKQTPGLEAFSGMGLNIDPLVIDCNPELLKRIGTTWVRMVLLRDSNYQPLIKSLRDHGIETVGVINRESIKFDPDTTDVYNEVEQFKEGHFIGAAGFYGREYPDLRFVQVGNEPDGEGKASWVMEPDVYHRLLKSFRDTLLDRFLIAAGLSSGQPNYLEGMPPLKELVDAIAIHPYGASPPGIKPSPGFPTAESIVERYSLGLPIMITELGVNHGQYTPEGAAARLESLLRYFKETVLGVAYYGASDIMLDPYGLFDKNGNPKLSLAAYMRVALGNNHPPLESLRLNPLVTADAR